LRSLRSGGTIGTTRLEASYLRPSHSTPHSSAPTSRSTSLHRRRMIWREVEREGFEPSMNEIAHTGCGDRIVRRATPSADGASQSRRTKKGATLPCFVLSASFPPLPRRRSVGLVRGGHGAQRPAPYVVTLRRVVSPQLSSEGPGKSGGFDPSASPKSHHSVGLTHGRASADCVGAPVMTSHLAPVVTSVILMTTPEVDVDLDQRGASRCASRPVKSVAAGPGVWGLVVRSRMHGGPAHLCTLCRWDLRPAKSSPPSDHTSGPDHLAVDPAAVVAD
jgi:hypothetical protein